MLSFLAKWWRKPFQRGSVHHSPRAEHAHAEHFDALWYLSAYPDVAKAGVDPWEHYQHHGRQEGRLPFANRALAWDHALWRGAHHVMLPRLTSLATSTLANPVERHSACWALARWYAWQGKWQAVRDTLMPNGQLIRLPPPLTQAGPALLVIEACCREPELPWVTSATRQALALLDTDFPESPDTALAHSNVLGLTPGQRTQALQAVNALYQAHGLQPLALADPKRPLRLDNLAVDARALDTLASPVLPAASASLPLISVIIPLFNAEQTIATALRGLFAQREVRLEIVVVDDASSDTSAQQVAALRSEAPAHVRLELIRHAHNQGAYAARNTGLAAAHGEFITTHDSDDWSHPQKLALQCQALQANPSLQANVSHWVRVTPELLFHRWRQDEYGWVYPNISSLMFRRCVFDTLGYWDTVSVNADTEWRLRVEAAYGVESVADVMPAVPLAFGLAAEGSLSQHVSSHLVSQFSGSRFRYMQQAAYWHRSAEKPADLYMPQVPSQRLFSAPSEMLRASAPANPPPNDFERLAASEWFDDGWYLTRYIDLQQTPVEPLLHYWECGAAERRDPGPHFSTSGYLRRYPEVGNSACHPLVHYLTVGREQGYQALPVWQGQREFAGRPTVMLCAHQAGEALFGAERSLVDVLEAMGELRWNVVVTLPEANNTAYEQTLLSRCQALAVLPYGWWQVGKPPVGATVDHFQALIERFQVKAVHGNTVVLHEPYEAARRAGIVSLVHVRELPEYDDALRDLLGATSQQVVAHVESQADLVVANSRCVAQVFASSSVPLCVVPNTIDMAPLLALPPVNVASPGQEKAVRVGMLSSNLAKKGLADVEAMARHLLTLAPAVSIVLYGARTPMVDALLIRQAQGRAPENIRFAGYVAHPAEALAHLDIVVNLSRFQESFGRSVLEAMAAGRPVVAYEWGALGELVKHEETGLLVPYGEPLSAARCVAQLASAPQRCHEMGAAAQHRAATQFSATALRVALAKAYQSTLLPDFIHE